MADGRMRKKFTEEEINKIEILISHFEEVTGRELLIVATDECDPYPAASLRFAFVGTILILGFTATFKFYLPSFYWVALFVLSFILCAFLGKFHFFKRLALSEKECHRECFEKSVQYFYQYASSHTANGSTVMILLSELEHHLQILVDKDLKNVIDEKTCSTFVDFFKEKKKKFSLAESLVLLITHIEETILQKFPEKKFLRSLDHLKNTIYFLEN